MAEYAAKRDLNRCPTHPGVLLRDEVLPALGMTVTEMAGELMVTRQTLHRIMSGATALTPEMALRLGRFVGNGPQIWLRMQDAYDLWHAERKLGPELARIKPAKVQRVA